MYLHDEGQLILLILARKDSPAGVELGNDAAQAPHVDLRPIGVPQNDFRCTVIPTLDVGEHCRQADTGQRSVVWREGDLRGLIMKRRRERALSHTPLSFS